MVPPQFYNWVGSMGEGVPIRRKTKFWVAYTNFGGLQLEPNANLTLENNKSGRLSSGQGGA